MPLDIAAARHSRSAAKGNVTKVGTQIARLQALHHSDLEDDAIAKQLAALVRANEHFVGAHEILTNDDPDDDTSAQLELDLLDHTSSVENHKKALQHLSALSQASELVEAMEDALHVMELSVREPYYPSRAHELDRTQKAVDFFREARMKPGARKSPALKDIRDNATTRLVALKTAFHHSTPPPTPSPTPIESTAVKASDIYESKPPKLEFPVFDGQIANYVDWRVLFTSLLKKAPRLSEEEKRVHLLRAMAPGSPHDAAVLALGSSATYDGALKKIDETFFKRRLIYSTHLSELLRADTVHYVCSDLKRMGDRMELHLRGLKRSIADYTADQVLAVLLESNLAPDVKPHWRRHSKDIKVAPTCSMMLDFLREHQEYSEVPALLTYHLPSQAPETTPTQPQTPPRARPVRPPLPKQLPKSSYASDKCAYCVGDHVIFTCSAFKQLSVAQRKEWVRTVNACFNCLHHGHRVSECRSKFHCRDCSERHHSLLHEPPPVSDSPSSSLDSPQIGAAHILIQPGFNPADFSIPRTAIVTVAATGLVQRARAQLDSGAATSVITTNLAKTLRAPTIPSANAHLGGIHGSFSSHRQVLVSLFGNDGQRFDVQCHVLDIIPPTGSNASMDQVRQLPLLHNLELADPHYQSGERIDLLLEMGVVNELYTDNRRYHTNRSLTAEHTVFGWTVGGRYCSDSSVADPAPSVSTIHRLSVLTGADHKRQSQVSVSNSHYTALEQKALDHFHTTRKRDQNGRYRVALPRRSLSPALGHSRSMALKRLLSNEVSLRRKGRLDDFQTAVREYQDMGHAQPIPQSQLRLPAHNSYYMPAHGIVKESSSSTKLRIVFDASAHTAQGPSFNDTLLSGPSLYPMLTTLLNRFRTHPIALTADISKMFREVGLQESEFNYHRFLQREVNGDITDMFMTRLTFGVASSPFVATKVLHQLADDHQHDHPLGASLIKEAFYVDDCLTGAPTLSLAQATVKDLCAIFSKAQMVLRKFRSNNSDLLLSIPTELRETTDLSLPTEPDAWAKALGVHWNTISDVFFVATPDSSLQYTPTKRYVSAMVARTFDVMGWFAPALLPGRLIHQKAWALKLGWDVPLPTDLEQQLKTWVSDLPALTLCPVPRFLGIPGRTILSQQLHGFCDASADAFGGAVYVRSFHQDTSVSVHLLTSKARPAPIQKITIPRLELCGAVMLAQLLQTAATDLHIPSSSLFAWCDSSAVIGWIQHSPSRLNTYVANRVAKLTEMVNPAQWRYVSTSHNPADVLSRGILPSALSSLDLWWHGPTWLSQAPSVWPRRPDINLSRELPEMKSTLLLTVSPTPQFEERCSSFQKLITASAWVLKFGLWLHGKGLNHNVSFLSVADRQQAKTSLLKYSQRGSYPGAYKLLSKKQPLPDKHHLSPLSPFLDEKGLMRVGGRLQKAHLSAAATHPVILDHRSHIVQIMVRELHISLLHAGPSTVMATLAPTHYIPSLKRLLRKLSRECIICQRAYAKASAQFMSELPESRVNPARPFSTTGIDFAGPFHYKRGHPRRPILEKCYLCLYVCFSTRAVHLEITSNMSTEAFLAALTRFTARRGTPSTIHTDNGANFRGAEAELGRELAVLRENSALSSIDRYATKKGIKWCFNPARSPHMGGLWEAAVKAFKMLFKKVNGTRTFTMEQFSTMVVEAEGILNSRPLIPLDALPDDAVAPLTPGHFLIGGPITSIPTISDSTEKPDLLKRWNLIQHLNHDLWTRWKAEYLLHLQRRCKWKHPQRNFRVGDIVLLKDVDSFSKSWPMGRVTAIYPNDKKQVRVVDVRCKDNSTFKRAVAKLVLLLPDDSKSEGGGCTGPEPAHLARASVTPETETPPTALAELN